MNAVNERNTVQELRRRVKGGLRDRAKLQGLPPTGKPSYGYGYRYTLIKGKKTPLSLEPVPETYPIACKIWLWALGGTPIRRICVSLVAEGIPAPRGGRHWGTNTIHKILKNPIYGGRFFALKYEARRPDHRLKPTTYGNSSQRSRPVEDWLELDFPIESPVVTWPEYQEVQERLKLNKINAHAQGRRTCLLRGMLYCPEDGRRLAGRGSMRSGNLEWHYVCSRKCKSDEGIPLCSTPMLYGATIEANLWQSAVEFLSNPRVFMTEMERRRGILATDESDSSDRIAALERKSNQVDSMETELVGLKIREQVSEEAFQRQSALLRAERTHYRDEIERQEQHLSALAESTKAIEALETVSERIIGKLDGATDAEKRWVLETLKLRVTVHEGEYEISIGVPPHTTEIESVSGVNQSHI